MGDFGVMTAEEEQGKFKTAQKQGMGAFHTNFNLVGQGDLVFDKVWVVDDDKTGEGHWFVHHVMVATGNVKVNTKGDVVAIEVTEAPYSGKVVTTEYKPVKSTYSIGHTYRTGDNLTPTGNDGPDASTQELINANLQKFVATYQYRHDADPPKPAKKQ
jgi:hypothetical protein